MIKFNIFPNEILVLESELKAEELKKILLENTFKGSLSTSNITKKKFIGKVNENDFKIISSKSPKSVFCVFNGVITEENSTRIKINLKLHTGFRILFSVGTIVLASLLLVSPIELSEKLGQIFMFLILIIIGRFFFINILFNNIAENGINDLKSVLKMNEVE